MALKAAALNVDTGEMAPRKFVDQTHPIAWHTDLGYPKRIAGLDDQRSFLLYGHTAASNGRDLYTDIGRWCEVNKRFVLDRADNYECEIEMIVLMWAEIPTPCAVPR